MIKAKNISVSRMGNRLLCRHGMTLIEVMKIVLHQYKNRLYFVWIFETHPPFLYMLLGYTFLSKLCEALGNHKDGSKHLKRIQESSSSSSTMSVREGGGLRNHAQLQQYYQYYYYPSQLKNRKYKPKLSKVEETEQYVYDFHTTFRCLEIRTRYHEPYRPLKTNSTYQVM